jgi:predicted Rossmann-fold nucleotide-binding protein
MDTVDELFEALTLIQTHKILNFQVVVVGLEYWLPLLAQLTCMQEQGMVDAADVQLLTFTDPVAEALTHTQEHASVKFQLMPKRQPRRWWWKGE